MRISIQKIFLSSIFSMLLFASCTPMRNIVYLQDKQGEKREFPLTEPEQYRVQPNDNIYIQIFSNDQLSTYFNITSSNQTTSTDATIELGSYRVNQLGEIDFPYIGKIKVSGLTIEEIKAIINEGISKQLIQYSLVVKIVNRHFTLLGEFNSPGTYSFYKDYLTIFEAMGYGKDFTDYANRHKVCVIRKTPTGKVIKHLDLTKSDILNSDFYYILPNDIIYVEPNNRIWGSKTLPFTAILTTMNTLVLLYNVISNAITKN
jgi:polysaccharide export outer membrane protein